MRSVRCGRAADKAFFWSVWMQVIREAGERYGCGLAGWWIDDAVTGYYSAAPPWRRMWRALKVSLCDDVMM